MDTMSRPKGAFTLSRRDALFAIGMGAAVVPGDHLHAVAQDAATLTSDSPDDAIDITQWIWSGAVTETSAVVKAALKREVSDAQLLVSPDEDFEEAWEIMATGGPSTDEGDVLFFEIEHLLPDSTYWYALTANGARDTVRTGQFRTFPSGPASFTFAFGACAETGSQSSVFATIQQLYPLFFMSLGDFFYEDISQNDTRLYRRAYDDVLASSTQSALYRSTPIAYVWDDHDYGPNNSDGESASKEAAQTSYRDIVPHYPLSADGENGPIYQAFSVGRAYFILTDCYSFRSPLDEEDDEDKTMLGEEQKDWFKQALLDANGTYPVIFWVNTQPWIVEQEGDAKGWGLYGTEREEIATFIAENQITGLSILSGDAHMLAIDDGSNNDYAQNGGASFPVFHAAALDRGGSEKGGPYSEGAYPGTGQFGLVTVQDDGGNEIEVIWSGRNEDNEEIVGYRFMV
jgi:alkaline phosphatase D